MLNFDRGESNPMQFRSSEDPRMREVQIEELSNEED